MKRTETPFRFVVVELLQLEHVCLRSRYSVTAVVYLLTSLSLPYNGFTWKNIRTRSQNIDIKINENYPVLTAIHF
jgi:hypothetical protein